VPEAGSESGQMKSAIRVSDKRRSMKKYSVFSMQYSVEREQGLQIENRIEAPIRKGANQVTQSFRRRSRIGHRCPRGRGHAGSRGLQFMRRPFDIKCPHNFLERRDETP
jgi:hypothetical protein